jgi:pimeloyl-ACP methyl ester carboxylesterase
MAQATSASTAVLHGQQLAYQEYAGRDSGSPLLVLVHGVGSSRATWDPVLPALVDAGAGLVTVDLPGHGQSAKERGDYSLGALASTVRDLLDHLGHQRCVFVGHSLGGGVGMQFAYQFPERCQGLVLVASGGLGREASPLLRAASLPGAELVLPLVGHPRTVSAVAAVGRALSFLRRTPADLLSEEALTTLRGLGDPAARTAFLSTLRAVVDVSGQRVCAVSKLPAAAHLPVLLVWGDRDVIIPVEHGRQAAQLLPHGRLVVFPGAGHEPHRHDPVRFAELLLEQQRLVAAAGLGSAPLEQAGDVLRSTLAGA